MKKVILAPDSFKGTLSSFEVCEILESVIKDLYPKAEVEKLPVADGGEGTADTYLGIFGGKKIYSTVKSPLLRDIQASFVLLKNGTAVIETAAASGITIEKKNNPYMATTYGTGQLVRFAIESGVKRIILGLGGSATTDCGIGFLKALGARFYDKDENETGFGIDEILKTESMDLTGLKANMKGISLTVLCDVTNPLYGKNGAAYVFSPQKGADEEGVKRLDGALRYFAKISANTLGEDFSFFSGAGAAGGMGFACKAFLGAQLKSGANAILDEADFDKKVKSADLVITGEGKMDEQSFMGKVPFTVAKRSAGTKTIAFVGVLESDIEQVRAHGIDEVIQTNPLHLPFDSVKRQAKTDLKKQAYLYFKNE